MNGCQVPSCVPSVSGGGGQGRYEGLKCSLKRDMDFDIRNRCIENGEPGIEGMAVAYI